jgi:hypothetical protein
MCVRWGTPSTVAPEGKLAEEQAILLIGHASNADCPSAGGHNFAAPLIDQTVMPTACD